MDISKKPVEIKRGNSSLDSMDLTFKNYPQPGSDLYLIYSKYDSEILFFLKKA